MTDKFLQPDPAAQRRVALAVFLGGLGGVILFYWTNDWLETWKASFKEDPESAIQQMRLVLDWLAVGNALFITLLSGYLLYFARRIRETGRHPPPGAQVVRPTRVREGAEAQAVARKTTFAALLLFVLGMGLSWLLHALPDLLGRAG